MKNNLSNKIMITSQELIEDSFKLGIQIIKSGFAPTTILVLWRGGATIGMAIHELMRYKNFQLNHMIIKTSSYQNTDRQETVAIDGYQGLFESLKKDEKILIVDDIFDTGRTVSSVISLIKEHRKQENDQFKIAVPWYKPKNNLTDIFPDFYIHETEKWVVFPHELESLSNDEIKNYRLKEILS